MNTHDAAVTIGRHALGAIKSGDIESALEDRGQLQALALEVDAEDPVLADGIRRVRDALSAAIRRRFERRRPGPVETAETSPAEVL